MKYNYVEYGNSSSRELVLIIHGTGGSNIFGGISRQLDQDIRYVAISLPGHDGVSYNGINSLSDFVFYIKEFLKILEYDRLNIIGFSLGGMIAISLFKEYREELKISKIVCWATPFLNINILILLIYPIVSLLSFFISVLPRWFMRFLEVFDLRFTQNEFDVLQQSGLKSLRKTIGVVVNASVRPIDDESIFYLFDKFDNLATKANLKLLNGFSKSKLFVSDRSGHFGTKGGWSLALKEINNYLNN